MKPETECNTPFVRCLCRPFRGGLTIPPTCERTSSVRHTRDPHRLCGIRDLARGLRCVRARPTRQRTSDVTRRGLGGSHGRRDDIARHHVSDGGVRRGATTRTAPVMNARLIQRTARSDDASQPLRSRVVVIAVDGSAASRSALKWAQDELLATGDQVRVVTAYDCPQYSTEYPVMWPDVHEAAEAARYAGADAVVSLLGSDRGLDVEQIVECGSIDNVLHRHCADASLIVVGTGPRHRLRDRLRASTSRRIIGRTTCPVITVPRSA